MHTSRGRGSRFAFIVTVASMLSVATLAGPAAALAGSITEPAGAAYSSESPASPRDLGTLTFPFDLYGRIKPAGEIDTYVFVAAADDEIPVALGTPSWLSLGAYRPAALFVPAEAIEGLPAKDIPTLIANAVEIIDPGLTKRATYFDGTSLSRYYMGGASAVAVRKGRRYVVAVFNTEGKPGAYKLSFGREEPEPWTAGLAHPLRLVTLKLGMYGGGGPDAGVLLFCLGDALLVGSIVWVGVLIVRRARSQHDGPSEGSPTADAEE